jgi:FkbM family methyltransferase
LKKIIKAFYNFIPFKQQLFSIIRSVVTIPNSISKHLYFDGQVSFKVNGQKIVMNQKGYDVENTLFWRGVEGCWEKVSVGIWLKLCEDATHILDIGANTGAYALIAKTVNPKAKVFAFEPMDMIYDRLSANVALNNLDITSLPYALSNFNGTAKVYPESENHIYSVTVNQNRSDTHIPVFEKEIQTKTLEQFASDHKITKIDLVKIDVETHEPEVLEGFGPYLAQWKPTMLIEVLDNRVVTALNTMFEGLGYVYFNIDEDGGIRQSERIEMSDYYNYLVCMPTVAQKLKLI